MNWTYFKLRNYKGATNILFYMDSVEKIAQNQYKIQKKALI